MFRDRIEYYKQNNLFNKNLKRNKKQKIKYKQYKTINDSHKLIEEFKQRFDRKICD